MALLCTGVLTSGAEKGLSGIGLAAFHPQNFHLPTGGSCQWLCCRLLPIAIPSAHCWHWLLPLHYVIHCSEIQVSEIRNEKASGGSVSICVQWLSSGIAALGFKLGIHSLFSEHRPAPDHRSAAACEKKRQPQQQFWFTCVQSFQSLAAEKSRQRDKQSQLFCCECTSKLTRLANID